MSRRIAILAALPGELKSLVQGWTRVPAENRVYLWTHRDAAGNAFVAACAGMGADAVRRAFVAAESGGKLDLVISAGFAGATGPTLKPGSVGAVTEIVDAETGERFLLDADPDPCLLATVAQPADAAEKARLLASYGASLVDMEAATVARLAAMRALPVRCFKAVSDASDAVLPPFDRFVDGAGQLRVLRLCAYLALRPRYWAAVAGLATGSRLAAKALAVKLHGFFKEDGYSDTNAQAPL